MENNINSKDIIFRSKFSDNIQCETERDVFVSAFKKFISLDKNSAIDIIWQMSYNPCSPELWKIGLAPETFSEKVYSALRSELRHQYEKFHHLPGQISRDFWSDIVPVSEEAITAFDKLATKSNVVVATIIYQKCHAYLLAAVDIERVIYLVGSEKENEHHGGICALGFKSSKNPNESEANYLKSMHSYIYDLLYAMFNSGRYKKSSLVHKPFEHLDQQIKDKGNDLPFFFGPEDTDEAPANQVAEIQEEVLLEVTPIEKPTVCIPTFISITAENVLEHKDVFSAFAINRDMSGLIQLNQLGFDLNQVVAKEEAITNLLKASEALNN